MTPLPISLAAVFLGTGNCSSKIVHKNKRFFPKIAASMFVKFISGICKSVIEIFRDEVFMVKKKNGQKWTIFDVQLFLQKTKRFDMQFHLTVALFFLKTCVRDYGDSRQPADCQKEGFDWHVSRRSCLRFCKHFGLLQQISQ